MLLLTHKYLCLHFRRTLYEACWTSALFQHPSQPQHHGILRLFLVCPSTQTFETAVIQNIFSHRLGGEILQMHLLQSRSLLCKETAQVAVLNVYINVWHMFYWALAVICASESHNVSCKVTDVIL